MSEIADLYKVICSNHYRLFNFERGYHFSTLVDDFFGSAGNKEVSVSIEEF
jgi:hypothetical protein